MGSYVKTEDELQPIHVGIPSSFEIDQPSLIEGRNPQAHWYHAAFHSVCAVVGAGVLGLPYAFRYLGWVGGLLSLTTLFCVSLYTSYLLSELHEDGNIRLNTYREIGQHVWGETKGWWAVAPVQCTLMAGLCITYAVTAGQSLKGIASAECSGVDCQDGIGPWIVVFGIVQLFLSQVPDFHSLWWVSLLGGVMSIGYCTIAAGGSIAVALDDGVDNSMTNSTDTDGVHTDSSGSTADTVFGIMNALGSVAFTFGGQAVVPEIQATLATPPRSPVSMMKAIGASYIVVFFTYYSVGISGYAAFGSSVEPDILLSIKRPHILVDIADVMVVVHVAAGYQVFAMPLFDIFEKYVRSRMFSKMPRPIVLRLLVRSVFVCVTTFIAVLVPFFGDLMGLIASIGLMPVTFILPPLLWIHSRKPTGVEFWVNAVIAGGSILLALVAFVGSVRNIVHDASQYDAFNKHD